MSKLLVNRPVRSKIKVGLLACFFGWIGAHWWYVGRRYKWIPTLYSILCLAIATTYPTWYKNPAFFLIFIPMVEGFVESVVLCLLPDEKFNQQYNVGRGQFQTDWKTIGVAILAMLVATITTTFSIAVVVLYTYESLGWLKGYG